MARRPGAGRMASEVPITEAAKLFAVTGTSWSASSNDAT